MDASIIALIINLVLVLFLVFGLLWGLGRGFKKSLVRLAYLLVFVVIFALLSPVISSALLNINLPQSFVASIASGVEIPAEGMSITALLELLIVGTADSPRIRLVISITWLFSAFPYPTTACFTCDGL